MKKSLCFSVLILCTFIIPLKAQMGVNSTGAISDPSAMLDVSSTTKGFLAPRMISSDRTSIINPAKGLMVYDIIDDKMYTYNGAISGWKALSNDIGWALTGNTAINQATNFIGTTDKNDVIFKTNNTETMRIAYQGGLSIGTPVHTEALDLAGNANISGEIKPNGITGKVGQILQSNGNGTMSWAAINKYPNSISYKGLYSNVSDTYQTFSFTVPTGITQMWVECWSGGDSGGFLPNTITNTTNARGGNAGSYLSGIINVVPSEVLTLLVGNGGISSASGGITYIYRSGSTPEILGITPFETYYAIVNPTTNTNGVLSFINGSAGKSSTMAYQQAGTTSFIKTYSGGDGGSTFPYQLGGSGVTVAYDLATNNAVSFLQNFNIGITNGSKGGNGATPGGGGGVGFPTVGFVGAGGVGMIILHW